MDLWWRNPRPYVESLKKVQSEINVIWDISYLLRYGMSNPFMFMSMNFGVAGSWRYTIIDPLNRYAKMHDSKGDVTGEFHVWNAEEDDPAYLVDYIEQAESGDYIFIWNLNSRSNKEQVFEIANLQKQNPDIIFHAFNYYSYNVIFGQGFRSGDVDPIGDAKMGVIKLPSGKGVPVAKSGVLQPEALESAFWIKSLGFKPSDMASREERIKYNIVSASWAAIHFTNLPQLKSLKYVPISSTLGQEVLKARTPFVKTGLAVQESDKKACDFCSLWSNCRYYREGSVCTVPGSDYNEIAGFLKTRDAFSIARGISDLLAVNVQRIEEAREAEKETAAYKKQLIEDMKAEDNPERAFAIVSKGKNTTIDPELTKLIDSTVKSGLALANLFKASEGSQKVVIQVTGASSGADAIGDVSATPAVTRELAARAVAEIEASGVAREDINPEHIEAWMAENVIKGEAE